jgi:CRISPR-associated protein Cpf1
VLEDLNFGFKQGRQKIEKSVYQQFEAGLINKLSYVVMKNADEGEPGHVLSAYQLSAPFESFQKMGKQTGIVFYVPAGYTSAIDPITGFRKNLYLSYKNKKSAELDIANFTSIQWNIEKEYFEFTYDSQKWTSSTSQKKEKEKSIPWTVTTFGDRIVYIPKFSFMGESVNEKNIVVTDQVQGGRHGSHVYFHLTEEFKSLFSTIDYSDGADLRERILAIGQDEKWYRKFYFFFNLILKLRNSLPRQNGIHEDYILSPVKPFFDSRNIMQFKRGSRLPENGDENGAYHIALKGALLIDRIKEKSEKPELFISDIEWQDWLLRKKIV